MAYGSMEDMTVLVTDGTAPREDLRRWSEGGVEVIVTE